GQTPVPRRSVQLVQSAQSVSSGLRLGGESPDFRQIDPSDVGARAAVRLEVVLVKPSSLLRGKHRQQADLRARENTMAHFEDNNERNEKRIREGADRGMSGGSRRKFLKLMGSASVAAVGMGAQMRGVTPPRAKTNSPAALDKVTQVDGIVIGGGVAGTAAAAECCN